MFVKVKVFPAAKENKIVRKSNNCFEVKVKEKPIQGRANKAVISIIADYLGVDKHRVKLVKGSKIKNKIFEIVDD